ncbi:MAG: hypothetical protein AAGA96_13080 [Verrucomicrobiota bacterium]
MKHITKTRFNILVLCLSVLGLNTYAEDLTVGNESFVHLKKINDVWWLVDGNGERFVSTGMNHIQANIRFAPHNKEYWAEKFGENILVDGRFNSNAIPEIHNWMAQVAKDHDDFGFNTIPFHRQLNIPDEYFEELGIFYLGKIKTGVIHADRVKQLSPNGKFPDVFSDAFRNRADAIAKDYCGKHRDNKYLLGYSYEDLPSYEYQMHKQAHRRNKKDFAYHPWVADIINREGPTKGKRVWLNILKENYSSPKEVAANYNLELETWEDTMSVSQWPEANDKEKWLVDQEEMSKRIVDNWHRINREVILKYDPNHLIFGDKIFCHGAGHPDWVFEIVGKYVDVLLIQDFEFFKPSHVEKLKRFHRLSQKPVLNGDASFGYAVEEQEASKGVQVESHAAVGEEYATYLKGIMNLPFMVGWHNCGYLEQWAGGRLDNTGKQQTGFFDPFGVPRSDALDLVQEANRKAMAWHEQAGEVDFEFSKRNRR